MDCDQQTEKIQGSCDKKLEILSCLHVNYWELRSMRLMYCLLAMQAL